MNNKKIQETFRKSSALSDDYSWESMEDGIKEKMANHPKVKQPFWMSFRLMGCLTMILVGLFVAYLVIEHPNKMVSNNNTRMIASENPPLDDVINGQSYPSNSMKTSDENVESEYNSIDLGNSAINRNPKVFIEDSYNSKNNGLRSIERKIYSKSNTPKFLKYEDVNLKNGKINPTNPKNKAILENDAFITSENLSDNERKIENPIIYRTEKTKNTRENAEAVLDITQPIQSIKDHSSYVVKDQKEIKENFVFDESIVLRSSVDIDFLPLPLKPLLNTSKTETISRYVETTPMIKPSKEILNNYIVLFGGMNKANFSYSDDATGHLRSKYERDTIGYQVGIAWQKELNKQWSIETGVQYNMHYSLLDYKSTPQKYEEFKTDAVLGININTIKNDTSVIIGQGIERGTKTRIVKKLNRYYNLSIPLLFQYQLKFNHWNANLGIGTYLLYSASYTGKAIYAQDSISVVNDNFVNQWQYGMLSQARLGYNITNRIGTGIMIFGSLPLNSLTSGASSTKRSNYGINIYAAYKF